MPRHPLGAQPTTPAERMRRYRARRRNARVDIPRDAPDEAMIAALYLWLDGRSEHGLDFAINWVTRALFAYQAGDPIPAAASWVPWTPRQDDVARAERSISTLLADLRQRKPAG